MNKMSDPETSMSVGQSLSELLSPVRQVQEVAGVLNTRAKIITALFNSRVADAIKIKDRSLESHVLLANKDSVDQILQGVRQRIHQRVVGSF
jgi:hypothetical protein